MAANTWQTPALIPRHLQLPPPGGLGGQPRGHARRGAGSPNSRPRSRPLARASLSSSASRPPCARAPGSSIARRPGTGRGRARPRRGPAGRRRSRRRTPAAPLRGGRRQRVLIGVARQSETVCSISSCSPDSRCPMARTSDANRAHWRHNGSKARRRARSWGSGPRAFAGRPAAMAQGLRRSRARASRSLRMRGEKRRPAEVVTVAFGRDRTAMAAIATSSCGAVRILLADLLELASLDLVRLDPPAHRPLSARSPYSLTPSCRSVALGPAEARVVLGDDQDAVPAQAGAFLRLGSIRCGW